MAEFKIALEVAEAEFNRFADAMELDVSTDSMDEEDKKGFEQQKSVLLKAIQKGALVFNEAGEPIYTPQRTDDADPITFYEPTGASLMAMDKRKKTEDVGKMYALMGDMTKTSAATFSRMKMADLKVCQAIAVLFLG
jgi:hypothetical protein